MANAWESAPLVDEPKRKKATPASWGDINAETRAAQPKRDSERLAILEQEYAEEKNPANKAALAREIKTAGGSAEKKAAKPAWMDAPEVAEEKPGKKEGAPTKASESVSDSSVVGALAGIGSGVGKVALGAQHYVGKGIEAVGKLLPRNTTITSLVTGDNKNVVEKAGNWLVDDAKQGRAKLQEEVRPYKEKSPIATGAGELTGEVVSTLPVGGILAKVARTAAPTATGLANSLASGGFTTGKSLAKTASLGAKAADIGTRVAGGAVTGGVSAGLVNPDDAVKGAVIGGVLPPAAKAVGAAGGYAGNVLKSLARPFTQKGQDEIAASIVRKFADGGPTAINATEIVPGSVPTLAEATGNAGLATLQRGARDIRPNAFVEREAQNAAARDALFDKLAGNRAVVKAAKKEREEAADALYGKAFESDAMRRDLAKSAQATRAPFSGAGLSSAAEDLATTGLRELAQRPLFKQAAEDAKRLAENKGRNLKDPLQSLEGLHYIKLALDDMLNPAAKTAMGRNASGAVSDMRDKLAEELAKVSPLYGNARQTYAEMSRPITAMETLQDLRLTDARGNITLAKINNAIRNLEDDLNKSGISGAKALDNEQLRGLYSLRDDLLRQADLGLGTSPRSNTFQNIATDNILGSMLPGSLGSYVTGKAGPLLGQLGRLAYSGPNEAIRGRLADMMLEPKLAEIAFRPKQQQLSGFRQRFNALSDSTAPALYRAAPVAITQ